MEKTAIIGAGPAGLVAARWLVKEGFEPVLFEEAPGIGGQWGGDPRYSGVWPEMRTNTSRILTCFGDLEYPAGTRVFPTNRAVTAYLRAYAEQFDLLRRVRLNTRVEEISRAGSN